MTVRTVKLGGSDWSDGAILYAADLNDTSDYIAEVADEVYTGTGFNCSNGSSANTTLTVAANIITRYVKIVCTTTSSTQGATAQSSSTSLDISTSVKDAGSWTSRFNKTLLATPTSDDCTTGCTVTQTVEFYYAPTAGEISGGLDIKFTGTTATAGGAPVSLANVQTVILVM